MKLHGFLRIIRCILSVAATYVVITHVSSAAVPQQADKSQLLKELTDRLEKGDFPGVLLNKVVNAKVVEAIPVLKSKFADIKSKPTDNAFLNDQLTMKSLIASALVQLGEPDRQYWDYLVDLAKMAVDSDAPFPPFAKDKQGNLIPKVLSNEFVAWAKSHRQPPEVAARDQMGMQLRLTPLAKTGDPRGYTILRKALLSRNTLIQAAGAQGLALLGDKNSIPLIVNACANAPDSSSASLIARALIFFDDPAAQSAARRFISDGHLLETLRATFREKGPRGQFE
jgi:hypothetical protein